jgi:hypothetical protein
MPNKTALYGRWATPGGVLAIESQDITTGDRFFVDSGATNVGSTASYGNDPNKPLASLALAYSLNKPTADNGDYIYLQPGHTENVIGAAGIAADIAGVYVKGLGVGASKPTITFTTDTAAQITMAAASTVFENIRFVCDIDAMVVGIAVTGADVSFIDCDFIDNGTDNALYWVSLSATADRFKMFGCRNYGTATAGNTAFLTMAAVSDVEIYDLRSRGDFSAANIECTAAPVDLTMERLRLANANAVDVCIEGFAAASGDLYDCLVHIATDAQTSGINTAGALGLFDCYQINNDGESGLLIGAASV